MLLVVDNGSVYTDSIMEFLRESTVLHKRVGFDKLERQEIEGSHSVILSGRRRNDPAMNATNSKLIRHALSEGKPLLGICYGAEILAITLGGTIRKMAQPRHGIYDATVVRENPLCKGGIKVFESHSYQISTLDKTFGTLAVSDQCKYEIFQYGDKNIFGTQFHPEMSQDGRDLLKNFVSIK